MPEEVAIYLQLWKIGARMPDGTIYAGTSPDTKKAFYAAMSDAPVTMTLEQARQYAASLKATDPDESVQKGGWSLPTQAELKMLYENRVFIGGFNVSGSFPDGWYWSNSQRLYPYDRYAWEQRFSDGCQEYTLMDCKSSVRCVR